MHYEMQKPTGEYPIIGVNTFRNPHTDPNPQQIELARSTTDEKESQLNRLADFHARHAGESPAMLQRLQQSVIDNQYEFAVLMDAVRCRLLDQINNALFELGVVPAEHVSSRYRPRHRVPTQRTYRYGTEQRQRPKNACHRSVCKASSGALSTRVRHQPYLSH